MKSIVPLYPNVTDAAEVAVTYVYPTDSTWYHGTCSG